MEIRRVLCPVDFSATSVKALHYAAAVARWYGADLHVLHVIVPFVPAPTPLGAEMPAMVIEESRATADLGLREMIEALHFELPVVRPAVRHGASVGAIVDYARDERIDLTVIGTHGSTGLDHDRRARPARCAVPGADDPARGRGHRRHDASPIRAHPVRV
jgi:universal stress protein A